MSTFSIAQQTYQPGSPVVKGPFAKPAGAKLISLQLATPTDWTSGAAGRVLDVLVEKSFDSGATFAGGSVEGSCTTPQLAKDGVSLPTIVQMDTTADPDGTTQYRVTITASGGSIKVAGTLTVA